MHISLDVTYMYTNFGGETSPVSEILLHVLSKTAIYSMVIKKFNCLELAQKNHASTQCRC